MSKFNTESPKKILIVYGTRYGSTEGVVKRIEQKLAEVQWETETQNLKILKKGHTFELSQYAGIIIGTGIKMGRWTKQVQSFLKKHKKQLQEFNGKKAFFVSSGYAVIPEEYEKIKQSYIVEPFKKLSINLDLFDAFGGLFDFTKHSRMSWLDKKVIEMLAKSDDRMNINLKGLTDLRDWNQIDQFIQNYVSLFE
ncbi:MAG: flavodoxin domain-containing protein [Candidatus Heimdallarchaeaceae archaeon]